MTGEKLLDLYRQMLLIRRFEEEAARAYTERKIGGFCHLYIGQEAVAVGALAAASPEDYVISSYRDHGHYLARGGSARQAMAELFGKETGCAKGRGGSMHFFSAEHNFFGGHGIVGAHVPVAAGYAFAAKYRGEKRVTLCFMGDGAVNIGPFHEGMSLAALWKLPVVFIVENNFYSMGTPIQRTAVTQDVSVRALGYPMERDTVSGMDVVECYEAARKAIERARCESLPTLLEYQTYRFRGHSMADPGKYRTKEEVEEKKKSDPLVLAVLHIKRDYPHLADRLKEIEASVEEEVADSLVHAETSREPDPNTVSDYTYV